MARESLGRRRLAIDAGVALIAFAFTVGLMLLPEQRHDGDRTLDAWGVLLAAFSTLPLVAHRRAPIAVFVFVTLASSMMIAVGYPPGPPVGPAAALFYVGSSGTRVRGSLRLTLALVLVLLVVHLTAAGIALGRFPAPELLLGAPLFAAVWFGGDRLRLRRERMAELEERTHRLERDAERERQLAVAEERTRIARDLHDSAGHAINVILVHAGAARLLSERDPARARRALETIETVARETLGEIDHLVHALREDDDAGVEPPAGLGALASLVQRHRDAGLDIDLTVTGDRHSLGPPVDRAAFRILQESLTNALRHGDGQARVQLAYRDDALEIEVTNAVNGEAPQDGGHGVVGMQERASLVGGMLDAAPADGVFRVRAELPYAGVEAR
jgi:signal transduction histidine kinase